MTILSYKGTWPKISRDCFVADSATVIGDVILEEKCSVWFGAVVRADGDRITIGKHSNIQDNCVIHAHADYPIAIGERVSIAHGALIHGARIGSNSSIGMGTAMLTGSEVGKNCEIGAGLVLFKDVKIPDNTLLVGSFNTSTMKVNRTRMKMISSFADDHYELSRGMLSSSYERKKRGLR